MSLSSDSDTAGPPRATKIRILDEVVAVTGYHRKSALRLLSGRKREARGGRVPVEYDPDVAAAARVIHEAAGGSERGICRQGDPLTWSPPGNRIYEVTPPLR